MNDKTIIDVLGTRRSLIVDPRDNVATLLDTCMELDRLSNGVKIETDIPFGHKVAVCDIKKGEAVFKYGISIGTALNDIATGGHIHVHNLE